MSSNINSNASRINQAYPEAGKNQSSQGFRDNFRYTKNALETANREITDLHNKTITVQGDVTFTSQPFGPGPDTVLLDLRLPVFSGAAGNFDTSTHDIKFTVNENGSITSISSTLPSNNVNISTTYGPSIDSLGQGTGTVNIPTFTFDSKGRVKNVDNKSLSFGLLGHNLSKGQLLAGSANGSSALPAPSSFTGNYFLSVDSYSDTGLAWKILNIVDEGAVVTISASPGLRATSNQTEGSVNLGLDFSTLSVLAASDLNDSIVFSTYDPTDQVHKRLSYKTIKDNLDELFLKSLEEDKNPKLGGDLDVNDKTIKSSSTVKIQSNQDIEISPGTNRNVILNGQKWPNSLGSQGQYLVTDGLGNAFWHTPDAFNQFIPRTFCVAEPVFGGDDTTGVGSMNKPFATISKALSSIPNNDANLWTIMILAGEFNEEISLSSKRRISIEGFLSSKRPVLTGQLDLGLGTQDVKLSNLIFDISSKPDDYFEPALQVSSGCNKLEAIHCDFIRGDGEKESLPIVGMFGSNTDDVVFDNCAFQGEVNNSLSSVNGSSVKFTNGRVIKNSAPKFTTQTASKTIISSFEAIYDLQHHGGHLIVENISRVLPEPIEVEMRYDPVYHFDWQAYEPILELDENDQPIRVTDEDGNIEEPDTGEPITAYVYDERGERILAKDSEGNYIPELDEDDNPVFDAEGNPVYVYMTTIYVQSRTEYPETLLTVKAGISSDSPDNDPILLRNVNLWNGEDYSQIYKLGRCPWTFINVERRADKDFLAGPRQVFDVTVDDGNFIPSVVAEQGRLFFQDTGVPLSNNALDPYLANNYCLTLKENTNVEIISHKSDYKVGAEIQSDEFIHSLEIIVKQDEIGGHSLNWSAVLDLDDEPVDIIWEGSSDVNLSPNSYTIYRFKYFSQRNIWLAYKVGGASSSSVSPTHFIGGQVIDAGQYFEIVPGSEEIFNDPALNCNTLTVEVFVLDNVPGSATQNFYVPATVVATVAKNNSVVRIYNESQSNQTFNILLKR